MTQNEVVQNILIVEDSRTLKNYLNKILLKAGYQVVTASSGEEALEAFRQWRPLLVLMDINLPGMNGYDLLTRLRQLEGSEHTAFIFLTSMSQDQNIVKGLELGADDYITKPFTKAVLLARIRSHLQRRKSFLQRLRHEDDTYPRGTRFTAGSGRQYEILRELPRGAMGILFAARDITSRQIVVVKTLRPSLLDDPDYVMLFVQEAKVIQKFEHPNLVRGWDLMQTDQVCFYVMEYVAGDNVRDLLNKGPLKLPLALDITAQVASALQYLDRLGYIHCDIKPDNMVIALDGTLKLLDFGLTKATSSFMAPTKGVVMGSPSYLSPERIQGQDIDIRSDIYALGITLYEMLTGKPPYPDLDTSQLVRKLLHERTNSLRLPAGLVPASIERLFQKMTAFGTEQRYQDPLALLADVNRLKSSGILERY